MLLTFVILSLSRSRGIVNDTLRFNILGLGTCTSQTVRIIERLPELVGDRATLREAAVGAPELHQPKEKNAGQAPSQRPIVSRMATVTGHVGCEQAGEVPQAEPLVGKDTLQGDSLPPVAVMDLPIGFIVDVHNIGIRCIDDLVA